MRECEYAFRTLTAYDLHTVGRPEGVEPPSIPLRRRLAVQCKRESATATGVLTPVSVRAGRRLDYWTTAEWTQ
jgi:hypothetical protein